MSDQERPCGCLFRGYEVVSQCIYHTGRQNLIESLQRENGELKADKERWVRIAQTRQDALNAARKEIGESELLSKGVVPERLIEGAQAPAITPKMRKRIQECLVYIRLSTEPDQYTSWVRELDHVLRDLLGEQGE